MTTPGSPRIRRSTKLVLWSAGLLVAAAAGVVLFLQTLDAEIYRRALERELSSVLDRTVSIGHLSFNVSLRPTLSARDLRIANPAWASRPDFVTAESGDVRIDLIALWHGRIELRAVHLRGVDLLLERNADGAGNWSFGAPEGADTPVDLPDFNAVSLADARFGWRRSDGSAWQLQVATAEATIRDRAPFELSVEGVYLGTPMRLAAKADASLQAALEGKPWRLSIDLEPKGAHLTLDARLPAIDSLEGAEVAFEVSGERIDAWSDAVGQTLPGWGPYRLSARTRYAQASLQIEDLRVSLDGLPVRASHLEVSTGKAVLGASVDTRLTAEGKMGDAAFSLEASSAPLPQLLKADHAVPLALRAALAQFALSAEGSIVFKAGAPGFEFAVTARGDALAPARVFADALPRQPLPVDLSARLSSVERGYAAKSIRGQVLGCTVAGDLAYTRGPRALLSGALNLGRLDLARPDIAALDTASAPAQARADSPPPWLGRVDTDVLLRIAAIDGSPIAARNISTRVQLREAVLGLQEFGATLADTDVAGNGTLRWSEGRPRVDAKARIAVLDLAKLSLRGTRQGPGSALDDPLPLMSLRALDGELQLDIARITGTPTPIAKITALARLQRGKLVIDPWSVTAADVPLQGRVMLDASESAWRIEADATAERIDLAALLRALKRPATTSGVIEDLQLKFDTQGTSVRALLARARLSARSAPFSLAVGGERSPVTVQRASLEMEPGGPLRASAVGSALGAPMDLSVAGGPLAELLEPEHAWPKVEATLRTTLHGAAFQVIATSGPLQRLIGLRDVPLALQATLPGARASFEGSVKDLTAPTGTPLTGRVEIANLAQTAALLGLPDMPALPFNATGRVTLGEGEVAFDNVSAQAGKSDASGRLRIRWRGRPDVSADLTSKLIDLTQWDAQATDEVPVLDRRIPLRSLLAQDMQLRVRAERFILSGYDLAKLELDGTLDNGLFEFSAAAAEGNLRGELRFDLRRDVPSLAARLALKEVEVQTLYTAAAGPSGAPTPLLSVRTQLAASGATLREMLATAQGEALLTAGAGTLPVDSKYGLEKFTGNLLSALVPGRKPGDYTQVECAAARFTIANGVATSSDGIALRLKQMDILGGGAVNLKTSQILFGYRAVRRQFFSFNLLGLTSGLAKVTGTLGNPSIALDPSGILIQGTAAWATAGLSVLAGELWRKLESTADPCARIAASAHPASDPLDGLIRSLPPVKPPFPKPATR